MSNPGVWTLTEKHIGFNKEFRVEDNLAESVHFHYNDIRIDLSIEELKYLSEQADVAIYELVRAKGFKLDDFDGDFLNSISAYLMNLESVTVENISTGNLYFNTKNAMKLPVRRRIRGGSHMGRVRKSYMPVVFNDDNTIMYGEKQVIEAINNGQSDIKIIRMHFINNKYTPEKYPWVPYLFKWNKKRILKTARSIAMKMIEG